MTRRKAIIITSPGSSPNHPKYLAGALKDAHHVLAYLLSPVGGTWFREEIRVLQNPNAQAVQQEFDCTNVDFLLVYFAGHGFHDGTQTMLQMNEHEALGERTLSGCAKRQLTIIDACRTQVRVGGLSDPITESQKHPISIDANEARAWFDRAINNTPNEYHTLYACSVGQTAKESVMEGGYFTNALLQSAWNWASNQKGVLDAGSATFAAWKMMQARGITPAIQQPVVSVNPISLPFAVHPTIHEFA
ncbi:MAG: caspase family protein [Candidatus Kapabacteria bacterium]|nr:caspase family protein [Candidatus Kapabacteria bacterium]